MVNNSAILTRDEYREFNDRVAILQGKGYDLPFEVEFIKADDTSVSYTHLTLPTSVGV